MTNKEKCFNLINELGAGGMLICDEANMHYLCSFSPSEGMILLSKDGAAYHLVDSRYTETAQSHAKSTGLEVIEIEKSFFEELKALVAKHGIKSLIFENETISFARYEKLCSELEGVELIKLDDRLMRIRNRKSADEIELMKRQMQLPKSRF